MANISSVHIIDGLGLNPHNWWPRPEFPVEMHVFHISSIVLVPWSSCLGGYSSVPDDYPLVLGCEEHVSLGVFVA